MYNKLKLDIVIRFFQKKELFHPYHCNYEITSIKLIDTCCWLVIYNSPKTSPDIELYFIFPKPDEFKNLLALKSEIDDILTFCKILSKNDFLMNSNQEQKSKI